MKHENERPASFQRPCDLEAAASRPNLNREHPLQFALIRSELQFVSSDE